MDRIKKVTLILLSTHRLVERGQWQWMDASIIEDAHGLCLHPSPQERAEIAAMAWHFAAKGPLVTFEVINRYLGQELPLFLLLGQQATAKA